MQVELDNSSDCKKFCDKIILVEWMLIKRGPNSTYISSWSFTSPWNNLLPKKEQSKGRVLTLAPEKQDSQ